MEGKHQSLKAVNPGVNILHFPTPGGVKNEKPSFGKKIKKEKKEKREKRRKKGEKREKNDG